jgi:hypothetical protein
VNKRRNKQNLLISICYSLRDFLSFLQYNYTLLSQYFLEITSVYFYVYKYNKSIRIHIEKLKVKVFDIEEIFLANFFSKK